MSQKIKLTGKVKQDLEAEKAKLTAKEALELLAPHKEGAKLRVHTFQGGNGILIGCDWDLKEAKAKFKTIGKDDICLSGDNMKGMGHAVAFWEKGRGWTFLETDRVKIDAIFKLRQIK